MSTVITRILKKLSPGKSDVGHVAVDDRGRNVWEWNDADAKHASTTVLLKRLDNDALKMADTQMWKRDDVLKDQPKPDTSAAPRELSMESTGKRRTPVSNNKVRNRFGKNTDDAGGFNPYG